MNSILANNKVKIRFICKKVSMEEYNDWYKNHPSYRLVKQEGTARHPVYVMLTKIADTKDWEESYLAKHKNWLCDKCKDRGITENDKGWQTCNCEFGKIVNKYI